jgi:predicted  nucleic acid-binding Zn-ribbon protein
MQANTIPSVEDIPFDVSPSTRTLLVEILSQLTTVKEEVAELREENRQKDQRIDELEARLEAHESFDGRERATDRQRITALETPAPALREETAKDHLNRLFSEMRRLKMRYVTIKDAARLLEISKPHMHKLKPYLADDSRFAIIKDPHHKQRHLIRLVGM